MTGFGFALVVDPWTGRVYVAGQDVEHSVMVVDPSTRSQIARIQSVPIHNSTAPSSLAMTLLKRVFWLDLSGMHVVDIDAESVTYNQILQVVALAPWANAQIVVNRLSGRVVLYSGPIIRKRTRTDIRSIHAVPSGYVASIEILFSHHEWPDFTPLSITRVAVDPARGLLYARLGDIGCYAAMNCREALVSMSGATGELASMVEWTASSDLGWGPLTVNPTSHRIYMGQFMGGGPETVRVFEDAVVVTTSTTAASPTASGHGVNLSFTSVQAAGQTTISPVDSRSSRSKRQDSSRLNPDLPSKLQHAQIGGPITLCFSTGVSDPAVFNSLHLLHAEGGVWVDRTTSRDYASGAICGATTFLSPFVVARRTTPGIALRVLSDPTKVHKRGSTAPIKVQVFSGTENVSAATLTVTAIEVRRMSDDTAGVVVDSGNANPDLNFRFDSGISGGGYIFNLSTKTLQPGRYDLRIKVGDDPTVLTTPYRLGNRSNSCG